MSATPQALSALRATAMFAHAPEQILNDLAAGARVRKLRRRQVLFDQSSSGDSLVVIAEGRLRVTVRSADGSEFALTMLGPGDTLGELSVVDGGARSADAEAVDESTVVLIDRDAMLHAVRRSPELANEVLHRLAADLRRLTDLTADLVFLDLPRRLAKLLVELAQHSEDGAEVALSQEDLAHHVGATRQSINAALRGFERRGWITVGNRRMTLVNEAALTEFGRS